MNALLLPWSIHHDYECLCNVISQQVFSAVNMPLWTLRARDFSVGGGEGRESKQYTKNWNLKVNICPHYFILQENPAIWTSPGLESGTNMVNAMQSKSIDKISPIKALAPENMEINTYLKIRKSLLKCYIKWVVSCHLVFSRHFFETFLPC